MSELLQYWPLLIVLGVGIYLAKKKDKKPTRKPFSINAAADKEMGNWIIAAFKLINKGNKPLVSSIKEDVWLITIYPGTIEHLTGDKTALASSNKGKREITLSRTVMRQQMKRKEYAGLTDHLFAKVIIHEYGHYLNYQHGSAMNVWEKQLIDSFGGKVWWPA